MDDVCRLCLRIHENMMHIFCENNESIQLQLQIRDCCSIEIQEDDGLPKQICRDCKDKLIATKEFKEQCQQSDYKLREYFKISISKYTCSLPNETLRVSNESTLHVHDHLSSYFFQNIGVQIKKETGTETTSSFLGTSNEKVLDEIVPTLVETIETSNDRNIHNNPDVSCIVNPTKCNCNGSTCDSENNDFGTEERREKKKQVERHSKKVTNRNTWSRVSKKEKYVCHMCQKVYVFKKALLKHTKAHINEEIHTCVVCSKIFNSREKLIEHGKKHDENIDFKCEVCGMPFKERVKLNFHLRVHGKGPPINTEKQYLCDICSRTFVSKSGFRFHLKSHTGSKPYTCNYCNKGFTIPSYKKRHERTHTGDKHFICHICSAAFASANGLKYHLRTHTGEANYHCEICSKSFRRYKYLKEHMFTHTGERPFACKICGSAYGNSGSLFVHEKKCKSQYVSITVNTVKDETPAEEKLKNVH